MMYQLPNIINSIIRINNGTIISTITVAQTVVRWLPTRVSGFKSPRCWWGPREEIFWHLNSKRITTDWPRKLQSYQQCIVGFFPQPLPGIGAGGYPRSTCFN